MAGVTGLTRPPNCERGVTLWMWLLLVVVGVVALALVLVLAGREDSDEPGLGPGAEPEPEPKPAGGDSLSPKNFLRRVRPMEDLEPVDEALVTTEATEGRRGSSGK